MSFEPNGVSMAEFNAVVREIDEALALLREARESWIKVGYGGSHEDVAECRDFCARIDLLITK